MSIPVTCAGTFRGYLPFIKKKGRKQNISHHMQYIEFLYKIKEKVKPELTTQSLLIKTIIIEYFTIIESVIDALLCQLYVKISDRESVPIDIEEHTKAERLFSLAKKYKIIDDSVHSSIGILKTTRNKIHIKRPRRNQKLECDGYTSDDLKKHERTYKQFLIFLFKKYSVDKINFPWPWEVKH